MSESICEQVRSCLSNAAPPHRFEEGTGIRNLMQKLSTIFSDKCLGKKDLAIVNLCLFERLSVMLDNHIYSFIRYRFADDLDEDNSPDDGYGCTEIVFNKLGWCSIYSNSVMDALNSATQAKVQELCSGEYETQVAPELDAWLQESVYPYVDQLHAANEAAQLIPPTEVPTDSFSFSNSPSVAASETMKGKLMKSAVRLIALARSQELFEMVADYPDSTVALRELRDCVLKSNTMGLVGKSFRAVLRRRLLHMGASTSQILDFYIAMVKALRVVDPSDLLLSFVAAPVRAYLKSRRDAVRCIVAALSEGKDSELHGELKQVRVPAFPIYHLRPRRGSWFYRLGLVGKLSIFESQMYFICSFALNLNYSH